MSAGAITMMVTALTIIWGGTAISIAYFMRHPERDASDPD